MSQNYGNMTKLAEKVADILIKRLEESNLFCGKSPNVVTKDSAYKKTEKLLYNYVGFKRIVEDRLCQIQELKQYGVPDKSKSIVQFGGNTGGIVGGIVLPEESVEQAVQRIQGSIVDTIRAIALVDEGMKTLKNDPYYKVLEMRYFDGMTQEDIALEFNCSQVTISNNKNRLVRELSLQLFPSQVAEEILN